MKGKKLTIKERTAKLEADKQERSKIFKELCDHLREGMSLDSFGPLDHTSVHKYLKVYPEEFIREEFDQALRNGRDWWERIGRRQSSGDCMGNSRTWFYNMANRYGWREKIDIEAEHKGQVQVSIVNYATSKSSKNTPEQQ